MFKTIDRGMDGLLRLRNRAMFTVLLNSTVRASELLSMNVNDIGDKGRVMVTGKGSKQRVVTIGESGLSAVGSYLFVIAIFVLVPAFEVRIAEWAIH